MRFKILLLPFFIVGTLILVIGYIKPGFDTILAQRQEISAKESQVANMETVLENINLLNSSLDTEQKAEQFA